MAEFRLGGGYPIASRSTSQCTTMLYRCQCSRSIDNSRTRMIQKHHRQFYITHETQGLYRYAKLQGLITEMSQPPQSNDCSLSLRSRIAFPFRLHINL